MPELLDIDGALLRLGVGSSVISDRQVFDLGGAGIITNDQPFDIQAPYVGAVNYQIFDISGYVGLSNSQPFDLGQIAGRVNVQVFDIIANISSPSVGTSQPAPYLATSTFLSAPATIGATSITVTSTSGITSGTTVYIGHSGYIVTAVVGLVLTLGAGLLESSATGTVIGIPAINTTLAVAANAGDTSIVVVDASAIVVGSTIAITRVGP